MRDIYRKRFFDAIGSSLKDDKIDDKHWLLTPSMLPFVARAFFLIDFETPLAKEVLENIPLPDEKPQDFFPAVSSIIMLSRANPLCPLYLAAAFEHGCIPITQGWQSYFKNVLNHPIARQLVRLAFVKHKDTLLPEVTVRTIQVDRPGQQPHRSFFIFERD